MHPIIGAGLRGFLLLCGAVVLGLSVTLAKKQQNGAPPSETSFSSFAGAFGIITSAIGLAALFVEAIPGLVPLVTDALAAVFYLAGGVAIAVAMKGISCTSDDPQQEVDRWNNKLINGGCVDFNGQTLCGLLGSGDNRDAINQESKSRCTLAQADMAFEFIACAFGIGAIVMAFLLSRNRSGTHF